MVDKPKKAFSRASKLSETAREALAALIMKESNSKITWGEAFDAREGVLSELAELSKTFTEAQLKILTRKRIEFPHI